MESSKHKLYSEYDYFSILMMPSQMKILDIKLGEKEKEWIKVRCEKEFEEDIKLLNVTNWKRKT